MNTRRFYLLLLLIFVACSTEKGIMTYRFSRDWYYFLGDNRDHSVDSRHYGLIPKDKLPGVVRGSW